MALFRNRSKMRVISGLVLLVSLPLFLGIDVFYGAQAYAQAADPEGVAYETDDDGTLRALAESKNFSALALCEWVRTEIDYEPYAGSVKGALGTYYSRTGNDLDQAVLLGALLDRAGKKWRLAVGDARLAIADAKRWLGVPDAGQIAVMLSKGGVPYRLLPDSNAPQWLVLDGHVWVEVREDYFPTRGAAADDRATAPLPYRDPEERWVAFDPSVTLRETPVAVDVQSITGLSSADTLSLIERNSVTTDSGIGVQRLPEALIRDAAVRAGKAFHQYATSGSASLAIPGRVLVAARQGLPGNLPYEVLGSPTIHEPDDLASFLSKQREYLRVSLWSAASGGTEVAAASIGVPRASGHTLSVSFAPSDGVDLQPYANAVTYDTGAAPVALRPVIAIDGEAQTDSSRNPMLVPIGRALWLEIRRNGMAAQRVKVLCGGYYTLHPESIFNSEKSDALESILSSRYGAAAISHQDGLNAYLSLVGQSILYQRRTYNRLALAALGWRALERKGCLVTGIEPTVLGTQLTSPSLVVHLMDAGGHCVQRVAAPAASLSAAETLYGLVQDVSLTGGFETLAGNDAFQSASRAMVVCNSTSQPMRTLAKGSAVPVTPYVPALPGLAADLSNRLRLARLVMADDSLLGWPAVGRNGAPADWAYLTIDSTAAARGRIVTEQNAQYGSRVPVGLPPLGTVADSDIAEYQSLLYQAIKWNELAIGLTDYTAPAVAGASGLIQGWLDGSGPVKPAAVPAAAIALHSVVEHYGRPQVESAVVAPKIMNTVEVNGNEAKTSFTVAVKMSQPVNRLHLVCENLAGNTTGLPSQDEESTTGSREFILTLPTTDLTSGSAYNARVCGELYNGVASKPVRERFVVDNIPPEVYLAPYSGTISGRYTVYGRARDDNFEQFELAWRVGTGPWTVLTTSSLPVPVDSPLATLDTRALNLVGAFQYRLTARDAAGNPAETIQTYQAFNDSTPPTTTIALTPPPPADLTDTVTVTVTAQDNTVASGITRLKFWIESQSNPNKAPLVLSDEKWARGARPTGTPYVKVVNLDTTALERSSPDELWRIVAESEDCFGNASRAESSDLKVGNRLWFYDAVPRIFAIGRQSAIRARFTQDTAWTLEIWQRNGAAPFRTFSGGGQTVRFDWDGKNGSGVAGPIGLYDCYLKYNQGGQWKNPSLALAIVPDSVALHPQIVSMATYPTADSINPNEIGSSITLLGLEGRDTGTSFIVTGAHPYVRITGQLSPALLPFLDGSGPRPNLFEDVPPYRDAFWTVEFKSSVAEPLPETLLGQLNSYGSLTNRRNWNLLAWSNGPGSNGAVSAVLDTNALAEGYYDVRLWETDGLDMAHIVATYIKVSRGDATPPDGGDTSVGALTLSATDMAVPMSGTTVEVSRSYNSNDVYAPGPLGYGWRLNGIHLEIEPLYDQGAGEYDEAMIRLPDGRKFFFANNPPEGAQYVSSMWAKRGEYLKRPFGMRLLRPGASPTYHWPYAEAATVLDESIAQNDPEMKLTPGAPTRWAQIVYRSAAGKVYNPGDVAYLQTEDKTWHIFEWRTGDLLEIIRPNGQFTIFTRTTETNVLIKDSAGRTVSINRAGDETRRVRSISDPAGRAVSYEYDSYGNLTTVTDRSGRRRFYIYDTPETKRLFPGRRDLTGVNLHYLVDVRVDNDADGTPQFDYAIASGGQTVRYTDAIPATLDEQLTGRNAAFQNYPGDSSVMKVRFEGGMMRAIETVGGSVEIDHRADATGHGGSEVVRNGTTGAETTVTYDDQRRVSRQRDPYGAVTKYAYFAADDPDANILGALKQETDALNHVTEYDYPDIYQTQYSSFSNMFKAYLEHQMGSDLSGPGYLTSAQAGPSVIRQGAVETNIQYETNTNSAAVFKPTSITAPGNNAKDIGYDSTGQMQSVGFTGNGTAGASVQNTYFASGPFQGRLSQTTSKATPQAADRVTSYSYATLPDGNEWQAVRDMTAGHRTVSVVDRSGNVLWSEDARGRRTNYTTDGEGRALATVDADGNRVENIYDVFGRVYKEFSHRAGVSDAGRPANQLTYYTYDEAGRAIEVVRRKANPDGSDGSIISTARNEYESDTNGRIETQIDSLGRKSRSIYDGQGGRLTRTESYDATGRILDWTAYEYDLLGRTVKTENRRGVVTEIEYDDLGRRKRQTVRTRDGYNLMNEYTYDEAGRQKTVIHPDGTKIENIYDDLGRVEEIRHHNDTQTSYTSQRILYDPQGWRVCEIDEEDGRTSYSFDALDRVTDYYFGYVDPANDGLHFRFGHDAYGNITLFTNGNGATRTKFYDARDRLVREYSPQCDAGQYAGKYMAAQYIYDTAGRLVRRMEGLSTEATLTAALTDTRSVDYTYDPWSGAKTEEKYSDGYRKTFAYRDIDGQIQRSDIFKKIGATEAHVYWKQYEYDPATGWLIGISTPQGWVRYERTDYGEVARITTSTGQEYEYTRDALSNLKYVRSAGLPGASGDQVTQYAYDHTNGRRQQIIYPNGTQTRYVYDSWGRLDQIHHERGATLLSLDYTRDRRGLITGVVEVRENQPTVTWTYVYDRPKRLTQATRAIGGGSSATYSYTYDDAGNRLSEAVSGETTINYTHNSWDQLAEDNIHTYEYGPYGNLSAQKTTPSGVFEYQYFWSGANELTEGRIYSGGALDRTVYFSYDDQNTRTAKRLNNASGSLISETAYLTDYENPTGLGQALAEYDPANPVATRAYVYGDALVAQSDLPAGGTPLAFFHGDHLGSIRLLTEASGQGNVGSNLNYAPYGSALGSAGSLTSYAFTGQYRDSHLGLQYNRARWLRLSAGLWLSVDPLFDYPSNFGNHYSYAGLNPANFVDPRGTMDFSILGTMGVSGIISGLVSMNITLMQGGTPSQAWASFGIGAGLGLVGFGVGSFAAKFLIGRIIMGVAGALMSGWGLYQAATADTLEEQLFVGILSAIGLVLSSVVLVNSVASWLSSRSAASVTQVAMEMVEPKPPQLGSPRRIFAGKRVIEGRTVYERNDWNELIDWDAPHPERPSLTQRQGKRNEGPLVPVRGNVHTRLHNMPFSKELDNQAVYGRAWNDWRAAYWRAVAQEHSGSAP